MTVKQIKDYFPNFHPHDGLDSELPIFLSVTDIEEIKNYLSTIPEESIVAQCVELEEKASGSINLFNNSLGRFPSKEGYSHRDDTVIIHSDDLKQRSLWAAIAIIIKVNNLIGLISYKDDYEILDNTPKHRDDVLKLAEAADIALAISDLIREYKLAQGKIQTDIKLKHAAEQSKKELGRHGANHKHLELSTLRIIIFKVYKEINSDGLMNNSEAASCLCDVLFPDAGCNPSSYIDHNIAHIIKSLRAKAQISDMSSFNDTLRKYWIPVYANKSKLREWSSKSVTGKIRESIVYYMTHTKPALKRYLDYFDSHVI